jgi:thiol-disulfide isomerase/thioredoxin
MPTPTRPAALGLLLAALLAASAYAGNAESPQNPEKKADWNESAIEWKGYDEGMQFIEILGKPGVLVFYTTWCPHCSRYSWVFHDPEVVELSKQFVMIRVDRDDHPDLNARYARQGAYVPRTLFLNPKGDVEWEVRGERGDFPHFLATDDPAELLALMRKQAR